MKTRLAWPTTLILFLACDGAGGGAADDATDTATDHGASTDAGDTTTSTSAGTGSPATDDTAAEDTGPGPTCDPLGELDPRRVLIETRTEVLASFTLAEVLEAIASNAGLHPDARDTHDRLFDSYRMAASAELDGRHCDDELVDGIPSLNGYALLCPRSEGAFAAFDGALDGWFATAIVNRLDLAPADGSDCGEQRMIFANPNMSGRAFIIFEARIPNPAPRCGVAACGPIAELWTGLDGVHDPAERAQRLRAAFVDGDAALMSAGFGPFMSADNLTLGAGQVRTNNFVTGPWTLRQFVLMPHDDGAHTVVRPEPMPVSASPSDLLWNDLIGHPAGASCRSAMLDALGGLLVDDVATMGWSLPDACLNAESVEFLDAYEEQLVRGSGSFAAAIDARVQALRPGTTLDALDVARRARFAGSCIGCHDPAIDLPLGEGVSTPASLGFVHVDEQLTEPCDGASECFAISPALTDELLPRRLEALVELRGQACDGDCAAAVSVPAPGAALARAQLERSRPLPTIVSKRGLTIGGRPVGAGH